MAPARSITRSPSIRANTTTSVTSCNRDWHKIGKKLQGKIHIYCGDMDNYYLNNAVYLVEEFLKSTKDPHYDGEVCYGDRRNIVGTATRRGPTQSHVFGTIKCTPRRLSSVCSISAPPGADLTSWRY